MDDKAMRRVVGWKVRDGTRWVFFRSEKDALEEAIKTGAAFEPVFGELPDYRATFGFNAKD